MRHRRLGMALALALGATVGVLELPIGSSAAPAVTSGFAIGDVYGGSGASVTFWGAQWASDNYVSGGSAPNSFKGYADVVTPTSACTGTFSTAPGNSSAPPPAVGATTEVLVVNSVTKNGPVISGTYVDIVTVTTNGGYGPDPGHPGTGTVVGSVCGGGNPD